MLASLTLALTLFAAPHTFVAGRDGWVMDGKPYVVRSGSMHYSRIPRAYWADRLRRARALGLNTICTYVFWNFHEPEPGRFDFKGDHDVAAFVREAQRQGLNVILRPGPYVCSEWEWGGFPYWLANIPGIQVRQTNPQFLAATAHWLDRLGRELAPLTVRHGGPIILCQVENEYGSFGSDHAYVEAIHNQLLHAGFDCQMYTADGSGESLLSGGTQPDLPAAINFGGGAAGEFANLAAFRSIGPRMNGEFWCGWFDHWGEGHHRSGIQGELRDLDWMLSRGDSVNLYMAHGGTTFGYMQGANSGGAHHYEPDTTSYDYDAPIAEDGALTPKFTAFRSLFSKYLQPGETLPDPPADNPHIAIDSISMDRSAEVLDNLPSAVHADEPPTFEELHHPYGAVVYSTTLPANTSGQFTFRGLQDRAWILVGHELAAYLDRASGRLNWDWGGLPKATKLTVVVESLGRINFSRALLQEHKGLGDVYVDGRSILGWDAQPVDLDDAARWKYGPSTGPAGPQVYRGSFQVSEPGDTYLDMRGATAAFSIDAPTDGFVWVNGHNLGRFCSQGPQQALYLPAPYLRRGSNDIRVFVISHPGTSITLHGVKGPIFSR